MKMMTIIGGVASSAVILAMAFIYSTAEKAEAAANPVEIVFIDRIVEVEVEVERVVHVPLPPQPRRSDPFRTVSDEDRYCLSLNIYFESRSQSLLGQEAVAWVTLNRVANNNFPDNICGVVWQPRQFSWTHDGKSDIPRDQAAWAIAQLVADQTLNAFGKDRDPTEGATYFHANYVNPYWTASVEQVVRIDQHIFYRRM
jgi:hypothetical protein